MITQSSRPGISPEGFDLLPEPDEWRGHIEDPVSGARAWMSGFAPIQYEDGTIGPLEINPLQNDMIEAYEFCMREGIPCRMICLKARKLGCSTGSTGLMTHYMRTRRRRFAMALGGKIEQSEVMLKMLECYITEDPFPWHGDMPRIVNDEVHYGNKSMLKLGTARDPEEGRADTLHFVLCTEIARWAENGIANATEVVTGLLSAVPEEPDTVVILESTARGASGCFWDYWQDAVDWRDVKAGRVSAKGKFIRIFSPWHVHRKNRIRDLTPAELKTIKAGLTNEERIQQVKYGLSLEQVEWRRRILRTKCKRDPRIFRREYPFTVDEAFSSSIDAVFNDEGLTYMEGEARQQRRIDCLLENSNGDGISYSLVPAQNEDRAWFWVWDEPVVGMKYLIAVDVMTGLTVDENGDDRDRHCALVIRKGYWNEYRQWKPHRIVAATKLESQQAIDVLAERIWELHNYYGGCMVVPEENQDRGLIVLLRMRNVPIYRQTKGDTSTSEVNDKSKTGKFGFATTAGGVKCRNSKAFLIENMARHIREWDTPNDGIEIPDLALIDECRSYEERADGSYGAIKGKHDDRVMACAIGLATINNATEYKPNIISARRAAVDPLLREEMERQRMHRRQNALRGYS